MFSHPLFSPLVITYEPTSCTMPEPYSAQWAYLPAINRSAEALSPAGEEVIVRTILMFILKFIISEVHSVHSYTVTILYRVFYIHLIQGFSCW